MMTQSTPLARARCVVLASGRGSHFENFMRASARGDFPGEIVAVLSDKPEALVKDKAAHYGVPFVALSPKDYPTRLAFDEALLAKLLPFKPDCVLLAGYMRKLSSEFLAGLEAPVLNIHPSLLPSFPGLHAQRQALEKGVRFTGATVHLVDAGLDSGPILDQAICPVELDDTEERLSERLLPIEHELYLTTLQTFLPTLMELKAGLLPESFESPTPTK